MGITEALVIIKAEVSGTAPLLNQEPAFSQDPSAWHAHLTFGEHWLYIALWRQNKVRVLG